MEIQADHKYSVLLFPFFKKTEEIIIKSIDGDLIELEIGGKTIMKEKVYFDRHYQVQKDLGEV